MRFNSDTAAEAGRKGGNRTKDPAKKRDKSLRLTVTQDELDMIDAKANAKGITRTGLVIRAVSEYK